MAKAEKSVEIGLVLQGGGALGAYEFGAVIALLELMDAIDKAGRTVRLVAVTGVSIGAINAACIVGARDRADARRRLRALWADLKLETPAGWWPRRKQQSLAVRPAGLLCAARATSGTRSTGPAIYDTDPMLGTLGKHVDFAALNAQRDRVRRNGRRCRDRQLRRFRNHPRKGRSRRAEIAPRHVLASGSLPPQFPATPDRCGAATGTAASSTTRRSATRSRRSRATDEAERFLVVMNLFRKERPLPKN